MLEHQDTVVFGDSGNHDNNGSGTIKQLSLFKHLKKKNANDAQLLMNRIALLQKEEERARRKIEQTKERAHAIIAVREDNERRIQEWVAATEEEKNKLEQMRHLNAASAEETQVLRARQLAKIAQSKKDVVKESRVKQSKLRNDVIKMKEDEVKSKMERHLELKRQEAESKARREEQKRLHDQKVREHFEQKARMEEAEVKRAEALVKALEQKEREWIERLRETQSVQEQTFVHLESALKNGSRSPDANRKGGSRSGSGSPETESRRRAHSQSGNSRSQSSGGVAEGFSAGKTGGSTKQRTRRPEVAEGRGRTRKVTGHH